jgi:hypothetical protein
MGLERTIHLDGAGPPDDLEPSRGGYSTGRWEGDELVVETVGFLPGILSADGRIPHSDQMRVVERFALDPARPALRRTYVAEDPLYLQGAYTGSDVVYPADAPYTETACDDRSYRSDAEDGPRRPPGAHNDFIFSVLPGELTSSWTLIWTGGGLLAAMGVLLLIRRRRR